ncbi:HNH endonuclease [Hydrogenovibrio kuenenii]|uniref:HNH endonuclease n=1 Tax=Hydrogenovibrio kuenenii TaxID=63658 RepID=UPI00046579D8|nr:HNH endonuclease [Hydrogenovibrio kuenenii]
MKNIEFYFKFGGNETFRLFLPMSVVEEFLQCFEMEVVSSDHKEYSVQSFQKASVGIKTKLSSFVNQYSNVRPELNRLNTQVKNLSDNQYFVLLPSEPNGSKLKLYFEIYLDYLNKGYDKEEALILVEKEVSRMWDGKKVLQKYDFYIPRTDKRVVLGNRNKDARCCRFCKKGLSEGVMFTKIAHAIPEALGNKTLILGDECDECNRYFGDEIEPALVQYLDLYRATNGIKGKKGHPKVVFDNCHIQYTENGTFIIVNDETALKKAGDEFTLVLKKQQNISPKKIYKALCKITLSTLHEEDISSLTDTVRWLRFNEFSFATLPKIMIGVTENEFFEEPRITNYIRIEECCDLPFIASELRVGSLIFLYMIPFSDRDVNSFSDDEEYQVFLDVFDSLNRLDGKFLSFVEITEEYNIKERVLNLKKR